MKDSFSLGLFLSPEREKETAIKYLTKTTLALYQAQLFKLIDCAYEIQNNKLLTEAQLEIFEHGMRQPLELIFCSYSGKFLSRLAYHFEDAKKIFDKLACDNDSKIRFNAVTLLLCNPPDDVVLNVIEKCINDPSKKVRKKVADVCERIDNTEILNLLERQYNIEKDDSVKDSLLFSIRLLKNGYILEERDENTFDLLVKTNDGLTGIIISKEKLGNYGIDILVKSIKQNEKII